MRRSLKLLRGIGLPPFVVGAARAVAEASIMAGLIELANVVAGANLGDKAWLAPLGLAAIRMAEGWADHIDPQKRRQP